MNRERLCILSFEKYGNVEVYFGLEDDLFSLQDYLLLVEGDCRILTFEEVKINEM